MGARPRGRESVQITNTGPVPIDLEPYRLISKPYSYAFAPNSIVQPGETMRVRLYESDDEDSALDPLLGDERADPQQRRRRRRSCGASTTCSSTCTAWGSRSC